MQLETERLLLRSWTIEDSPCVFSLAKDPHVGPPCGWEPHKTKEESKEILCDILMNDYTFAIVLKSTQEILGNISIMPYCESRFARNENQAEIGFWLGYPYWGNGYMTEACERMIEYGFEELNLEGIWCAHSEDNQNSMRVQQKCGFVFHHEESIYDRELDKKIIFKVNNIKPKEKRG